MPARVRQILLLAIQCAFAGTLPAQETRPASDKVALSGTLVDTDGRPVAGAKLTVIGVWKLDRGSRERAPGGGSGISDADGRVTIEGLPRGRILSLRFAHPDFPRLWFEATTVKDPVLARKTTRWEILADNFRITLPKAQKVEIRLVGSDGKSPLAGVFVEARPASDTDQIHFDREWSARGATDPEGCITLPLAQGRFELSLGDELPLDGIGINEPHLGARDAGHVQTFLRMIRRGADVVFHAVDADTGEPIPGVSFWREMPDGEYWFDLVRNETIGNWGKEVSDEESRKPPYVTDQEGRYRCQMRPARGWTYHVHHLPEGYVEVDSVGQTFDIPSAGRLEKTFKLRKKASRSSGTP